MQLRRHDSLLSRLGERTSRNRWRLWVEDNGFDRLRRNNFTPGTPFQVRRRPGTGIVIEQSILGSCHVSSRRGAGILSYEASDLESFIGTPDIRIRIHVGQIFVTPSLRLHSITRTSATETWRISGSTLSTPIGDRDIRTTNPLSLLHAAAVVEATLDEVNLVFATELIGNQRPGRVILHGASVMLTIAGQFLRAIGYGETGIAGEYFR